MLLTDFRRLIIDKILEKGGDMATQEIPCTLFQSSTKLKKYGNRFVTNTKRKDYLVSGGGHLSLTAGDLELIEVRKLTKGSISLAEI